MELLFEKKSAKYLREVLQTSIIHEETAESIVPDSYPDVDQILGAFGSVILRGKECRAGGVNISGGVNAGVIYRAENDTIPRVLHYYVPFTVRLEGGEVTENSRVITDCRVRNVDARIMNPRKVMVRVNLCGHVVAYESAVQSLCMYSPSADVDLLVKQTAYQVIRNVEVAEKVFPIAEEAELPAGRAPMEEMYKYQADVEVVESKLVGNKGVFKGNVNLCLLYLTEEKEVVSWNVRLPFSQYVEFENEYDEEELQTEIVLTDLNVEDANGKGNRLLINLQMMAQCSVIGQETMDVVEDAYSLRRAFEPLWENVEVISRLDRQTKSQTLRSVVQAPVRSVIDTQVYLDVPAVRREGMQINVTVPLRATVIYFDENGEIQSLEARLEGGCQTELAENSICRPEAHLVGEAFAVPVGEGVEIRCTVDMILDAMSNQTLRMLAGGQLGDEYQPTKERPSVILRAAGREESLWTIAKRCKTTEEAIRTANGLTDSASTPNGMLLIPILK